MPDVEFLLVHAQFFLMLLQTDVDAVNKQLAVNDSTLLALFGFRAPRLLGNGLSDSLNGWEMRFIIDYRLVVLFVCQIRL